MNVIINIIPDQPQKPKKGISAGQLRKMFVDNEDLYQTLVKSGFSDDEACKIVVEHGEKKNE